MTLFAEQKVNQEEINRVARAACDTFHGVIDAAQYKDYILIMLFLKYMSDVWKEHYETYRREYAGDAKRINRRLRRKRFIMPENCAFDYLFEHRNDTNIGELIYIALENIEEANKSKL